ncbi:MAG: hypothetical protein K0B85_07895 [Coriobacteriia bacterium]|nr:hypothetical protein [Coriobacteriia bacterium]
MKEPRRWLSVLVAVVLLLGATTAMAALVPPVVCDDDNPPLTEGGIRVDMSPPMDGTYTKYTAEKYVEPVPDDFSVTITFNDDNSFNFVSNYNIEKVVVKGGSDGAYCYYYYDYVTLIWEDIFLMTPSGQEVSHIDFYTGGLKKFGTRAIDIAKHTNGFDADVPTGPYILAGGQVMWTYYVTNTGQEPLHNISVADDMLVVPLPVEVNGYNVGDLNQNGILDPYSIEADAETWVYQALGTAGIGQYANVGTASGYFPPLDEYVTDTDPSHYFGALPAIDIEKLTNAEDADEPTGPYIHVGADVTWAYLVTNTGNVTLTGIAVVDDQGVAVTLPKTTLAPGESMTGTASGVAVAGQYANIGTVTGTPPVGDDVTDSDPSHYFGSDPKIQIVKTTKGYDGIFGDEVYLYEGDEVVWKYEVTATGSNVPLKDVVVTDDQGVTVAFGSGDTNDNGLLDPGETWVYYASGTAVKGWYENVGTAEGYGPADDEVDDSDPSSYFGAAPDTKLEAEIEDGATMFREGDDVKVIITEKNTGNVRLTDVYVEVYVDGEFVHKYVRGENLAAGDTWIFTHTAQATDANGELCAIGFGTDPAGKVITWDEFPDEKDCVSWTVIHPAIDIEKSTNRNDADDPTGPEILVGGDVVWTYVVTNTGDVTLYDVTINDDDVGVVVVWSSIAPGDSQTATVRRYGGATAGQYANIGTATGTPPVGPDVTDSDPSHYLGLYPEIDIDKTTNGSDEEILKLGDAILWRYTVTNTGTAPLSNIVVTDSEAGVVPVYVSGDTNGDDILDLDETWIYEAAGVVTYDLLLSGGNPYTNTGYAEGDWTDEFDNKGDADDEDDSGFTAYGLVEVVKYTNGGPNTVADWTFGIKEFGAADYLVTDTTTPTDGHLDFGGFQFDPLVKYTICEQNVPAGWTSVWYFNGVIVSSGLYNPDGLALPPENFGNVCLDIGYGTDFQIPADGLLEFTVDNTYPGGEPRTPGYWKNWSSVTNGGQMQTAFDNGGYAEGFWILDDLLNNPGFDIGLMTLNGVWDDDDYLFENPAINLNTNLPWNNDAVEAWRILSNYDVVEQVGKKGATSLVSMSNDTAYNLARNLLAAKLNLAAGAETGPEIVAYVAEAQEILVELEFNGTGSYLGPKDKKSADYKTWGARASELSGLLDYYNNGNMY